MPKRQVKKTIKILTASHKTGETTQVMGADQQPYDWPLHQWSIQLVEGGAAGKKFGPRNIVQWVDRVVFTLHPTFPEPVRTIETFPFEVKEKGYGDFDLGITVHFKDPANKPLHFDHSLQLARAKYEVNKQVTVIVDEAADDASSASGSKPAKKQKVDATPDDDLYYGINMQHLAKRLYMLEGEDILRAVDIVKKYRSKSTYIQEDVAGEFHFDLYTLTEPAIRELWALAGDQQAQQQSSVGSASISQATSNADLHDGAQHDQLQQPPQSHVQNQQEPAAPVKEESAAFMATGEVPSASA